MHLADCLIELVCHARWLASVALSRLSDATAERYANDLEEARRMLHSLSKSMSHIETLGEVPSECIDTLCCGVLHLLVGEAVCGGAPPTMHQFLAQTTLQRQQSAVQTHLLMVRWFSNAEIVRIDELLEVIFGPGHTTQAYRSDYDAHMAIARHLAQDDPFYLGAHVIVLRGVLLKYCSELIAVDDIVGHVTLVAPNAEAELHTMEDALLFWIRSILGMLDEATTQALALEVNQIDDLYLHTNDGRMLALAIHQYRPDIVPLASVHLVNPLTVWQRQDNWSIVTRAAESLQLWVGVFADEMVAHGFSTLQLHVLRVIQELFAVLAFGAERSYTELSCELEGTSTYVGLPSTALGAHEGSFANVSPGKASDHLNSGVDVDERSRNDPELCADDGDVSNNADAEVDTVGGPHDDCDIQESGKGAHGATGCEQVETREIARDEYNVVLTGMFLQGMKLPIHRQPSPVSDTGEGANPVPVRIEPVVDDTAYGSQMGGAQEASATGPGTRDASSTQGDADASGFHIHHYEFHGSPTKETISRSQDSLTDQRVSARNLPCRASGGTAVAASCDAEIDAATRLFTTMSSIEEPPRTSDSPEMGARGSIERRPRGSRTGGEGSLGPAARNPLTASVAHLEQFRRTAGAARGRGATPGRVACSVVQGSVDAVGIEQLLEELQQLGCAAPSPLPSQLQPSSDAEGAGSAAAGGPESLREQNLRLRWALEEQQRKISTMVSKLRKGIRKNEFNAILKHLRVHRPGGMQGAVGGASGASPEPVVLTATPPSDPLRASFAGTSERVADAVARSVATSLRASCAASGDGGGDSSPAAVPAGPISKQLREPNPIPGRPSQSATASVPQPGAVVPAQRAPVPADQPSPSGGTAFDVSFGVLRKPGDPPVKVPPLSIPQLQKLRERHQQRHQQQQQQRQQAPPKADAHVLTKGAGILPNLAKRNNRIVISNALKHVCLTGPVNKVQLDNALRVVGDVIDPNAQFIVLLKDEFTHVFRGLYVANAPGAVSRIYGAGPTNLIVGHEGHEPPAHGAFIRYFKFNTGTKKFEVLPSKTMNQMTDAIAITGKLPKSATPATAPGVVELEL